MVAVENRPLSISHVIMITHFVSRKGHERLLLSSHQKSLIARPNFKSLFTILALFAERYLSKDYLQ